VACWGDNAYGKCTPPAGLTSVTAIAAGDQHSIALNSDGTVVCWGANSNLQCSVPTDLGTAVAIAGGGIMTYAVLKDGTLRGWGADQNGSISSLSTSGRGYSAVATGYAHVAAFSSTFAVRAVSADGLQSWLFPTARAAIRNSPGDWVIEARAAATEGFVLRGGRIIHGLEELSITESVVLNNGARLYSEGPLQIAGPVGSDPSSTFESLAVGSSDAIVFGMVASPNIRTVSDGPVRVLSPIDLRMGGDLDVTSTHRLILSGGVYSSEPGAAGQAYSRFVTCTDDAHRSVSPCLEFGPLSVLDLPPSNKLISNGPTTTLLGGLATLRNGSSIETDADLAVRGTIRVPVGSAATLSIDREVAVEPALSIEDDGEVLVESNSSLQVIAPTSASVAGSMTVDRGALFSVLGGNNVLHIQPGGDTRCFGGTVRADEFVVRGAPVGSSLVAGRFVGVDALIDADTLRVEGGMVNLANGSLVGDLSITSLAGGSTTQSTVAASGQVFGDISNQAGKLISIGDLIVVGSVSNQLGAQIIAQMGTVYITGGLENAGVLVGNVITAPQFNGGGSSGTQPGDGIEVAGPLSVGASGQLRFLESLWRVSVCGDLVLGCASDAVRFDDATLRLNGCEGTMQTFEATSADLGCIAAAFSGEETTVSLIGELDVASGATVTLVDHFNNAPGKAAEVVYARGLTVKPGATLVTNGVKVVTRNALIQGTVDDMSNICVVVDAPDPDVNGDGLVNGIDLAFILTYWGSSAPIADLNDDGIVGGADLSIVLSGWTS
jgi:hypothetical protein